MWSFLQVWVFNTLAVSVLAKIYNGSNPPSLTHENKLISGKNEFVTCSTFEDCLKSYTPNIEYALEKNFSIAHEPICIGGVCSCGEWCLSRSRSFEGAEFAYCGPCGRVGSRCVIGQCTNPIGTCEEDGYCHCYSEGEFYDAYFCYIPYYGYEMALQMAITSAIIIAMCLLVASIYNVIGTRRQLRHLYGLRDLLRNQNGTNRSPPNDRPPKYDDVVEELPSYQEALEMTMGPDGGVVGGVVNLAFDDDDADYAEIRPIIETRRAERQAAVGETTDELFEVRGDSQRVHNLENNLRKSARKRRIRDTSLLPLKTANCVDQIRVVDENKVADGSKMESEENDIQIHYIKIKNDQNQNDLIQNLSPGLPRSESSTLSAQDLVNDIFNGHKFEEKPETAKTNWCFNDPVIDNTQKRTFENVPTNALRTARESIKSDKTTKKDENGVVSETSAQKMLQRINEMSLIRVNQETNEGNISESVV